jgi:hypothetical protein
MTIEEFYENVQLAVLDRLGEGFQTKIQEIQKNNGIVLQGLVIIEEEKNVSPMIYLEPFWDSYSKGMPFAVIVDRILQICREDTPKESIDLSFFNEFEKVKDRICFRLVSAERNSELLKKIPHIDFLDLVICFFYAYEGNALGAGSILIYDTHMKMWNVTVQTILELAMVNTPRIYPIDRESMEDVLREVMEKQGEEVPALPNEFPLWVISNRQKVYGATCILYKDYLKELFRELGQEYYVIPSSVHEILVVTDNGENAEEHLKGMIGEVNRTQVDAQEVLSDQLYRYNSTTDRLEIV